MGALIISIVLYAATLILVDTRSSYTNLNNKPVIDLNRTPAPLTIKAPQERRSALFPKMFTKFTIDSNETSKSQHPTNKPLPEYIVPKKFSFGRKELKLSENISPSRFIPKSRETGKKEITTKYLRSNVNIPMNMASVSKTNYNKRVSNYNNRREIYNRNSFNNKRNIFPVNKISELINKGAKNDSGILSIVKSLEYNNITEKQNIDNSMQERKHIYASEVSIDKKNSYPLRTNAVKENRENSTETPINNDGIYPGSSGLLEENYKLIKGGEKKKENENKRQDNNDDEKTTTFDSVILEMPKLDEKRYPINVGAVGTVSGNEEIILISDGSDALHTDEELKTGVNDFRQARNVNIIEEENQVTVIIPGFRFDDREPPLDNDQTFRNINL